MTRPPIKSMEERRAEVRARHPKLAQREARRALARPSRDRITLGTTDTGRQLTIDDETRLEHAHVIGATGCGKSTFLLSSILQDIARGHGVCVFDPHGGHPGSLMNTVLRFLIDHNWLATRKVHILTPNVPEYVVGFNPLAPLPGADPIVIADELVAAMARAFGDEDMNQKPLTLRILKHTFAACVEFGWTLPQAMEMLDRDDAPGLRRHALERLKNKDARRTIQDIDELAKDPRGRADFRTHVMGPQNRLSEFLSPEALRLMFSMNRATPGMPGKTIDLLDIIDRGHILLIDLLPGLRMSQTASKVLGTLLLRYFYILKSLRWAYQLSGDDPKFHPFFLYVDECHNYATEDLGHLLFEVRKFGIGVTLAHQFLAQLGMPGDMIYEAVRNSTEIKTVFRVKSPEEAEALALDVIPLDLEMPVKASIRPVQIGHTIGRLTSEAYAVHEGESSSVTHQAAVAISHGETAMQTWMRSVGHVTSQSSGRGSARATGSASVDGMSSGLTHMDSMGLTYDPQTQTLVGFGQPLGMNVGAADASSHAKISSRSINLSNADSEFSGVSESDIVTEGEAVGYAVSKAVTRSTGRADSFGTTRGTTDTAGSAEAIIPVYANLPTSFHSKQNVQYMAGQAIRALSRGRAIFKFRDFNAILNIAPPRKPKR